MSKLLLSLLLLSFTIIFFPAAYGQSDSLVRLSDLKYQSVFEKTAIHNFVQYKRDTFNLFLAIDKNMTNKEASWFRNVYESVYPELESKKVQSKKLNRRVKLIYSIVHNKFLKKYEEIEYFPAIFQTGNYNCVTASILYALIFEHLKIPFKAQVSLSHVYLVANPGKESVVIETTNPGFEQQVFNGVFKEQYVDYLKSLKQISASELRNKSTAELFEEKFKQVRVAKFNNLAGFQYYNMGATQWENHNYTDAVSLFQKAYFFDPNNQIRILLYNSLVKTIKGCRFSKVSDIDYLAQLSRFGMMNIDTLGGIFGNIIHRHLQFTNKEAFCDSLDKRLTSETSETALIDEFNFIYNLQMSYHYQPSDKIEQYVAGALAIKGNNRDARIMMANYLNRKLFSISDPDVLMDTIHKMGLRLHNDVATQILLNYRLNAYLQKAIYYFARNRIPEGNQYLLEFEKDCQTPVKSEMLRSMIERTYNAIAQYYEIKGDKTEAGSLLKRKSKYVPDRRLK